MTKSKKITKLFLALGFSCLTCGMAVMASLPIASVASKKCEVVEVSAAVTGLDSVERNGKTFYQIKNKTDLALVSSKISVDQQGDWASANYELTDDINLSNRIWTPIGTTSNPFTGYFNGNGHMINGVVSAESGSVDGYYGLFGYVEGAHIYDVVIGSFSYANQEVSARSGRLIGYAKNSVLADIYDESYIETTSTDVRAAKTIGTINGGSYYVGDTYLSKNGVMCKSGSKTRATLGNIKPLFDWTTNSATKAGYSIMVVADSDSSILLKGASSSSSNAIAHYRILVSASGAAVASGVVESANYYKDFAAEEISADVAVSVANGQPIISPVLGKKLIGWKSGNETTGSTTINGWINLSGEKNLWVEPVWKELSYNLNVVDSNGATVKTVKDVKYNTTWASVVQGLTKSGYTLTKLYDAYVDGATTTASKTYYSASVEYDSNYNKTVTPEYNNGKIVNHWDVSGKTSFEVKISSSWIGEPVNTTVQFKNTKDTGAVLNTALSNLKIDYAGTKPSGAPALSIQAKDSSSGSYTFKAIADQSLSLTFKLKAGYKVDSVKCSSNGTATHSLDNSTGVNTVSISGLLTASDAISIEIVREETTIAVNADSNMAVSISGSSSFTKYANGIITTRIGEQFNIVATPSSGYEYYNYQISGWGSLSAPTVSEGKATFAANITTYTSNNSLTITSKQKSFTVNFVFQYEAYSADSNAKPAEITFAAGSNSVKTNSNGGQSFTLSPNATIAAPENEYYGVGTVSMSKTGGVATISGTPGNYSITGIAGGDAITLAINYTKKQYSAVFNASFGKSGNEWTSIKGVDGNNVSDTSSIISFTPATYKYKDTITLTYDIVSQYYEFVGWYSSNGEQISTQNNATVTATASNMTFYGVIKGKTASVSLSNGNILANFDGTTGKYVTASANVNTGVKSLEYTYSKPTQENAAFTVNAARGYFIFKGIIHKSDWAGLSGTNLAGVSGTDYILFDVNAGCESVVSTGYGDLPIAVRDFIFNNANSEIEFIGAQKAVNVEFVAGVGATGESVTGKTYYYGGANINIEDIKSNFTKTGYTATGWEYTISNSTYKISDVSNGVAVNEVLFGGEILSVVSASNYSTLTITRTYTAKEYTITLDQNGATTGGTASVQTTFDTTTSFNITNPKNSGHTFQGWTTVKDGDIILIGTDGSLNKGIEGYTDENGKWNNAGNVTLYAKWSPVQYSISLNSNGGSISQSELTFTYGETMSELEDAVPTREGYSFDGWYYIVGTSTTEITKDTVFDSTLFTTGTFSVNGGDCQITLFAKWTFNFTLTANETVEVDYGTTISNQFSIAVTFNGNTKNINASSQEMPADLNLISWSWNPTNSNDVIFAPYILDAGTRNVTLTLTLADNGSSQNLLKQNVTKSVTISYTISAIALGASVNIEATQLNAIAANIAQLALDTNPVLALVDGDGYIAGVSGGTWDQLATYVNSLATGLVSSEQAWFYVVTKPMMAYKFMSLTDVAFSSAKFYDKTALKTMTFESFKTRYNSAEALGIQPGENNDYFAYSMQKYGKVALNIGLDGNVNTTILANGVSNTIDVSIIPTPNNTNCGEHTLQFQINVAAVDGFNAANFTNISKVSDNVYTLAINPSEIVNNKIVKSYVYKKPVVFNMTETTAVKRLSPYEFELTSGDYTAKVKTTSGAVGTYQYSDRSLIISEITPALRETEFAYVKGEFEIMEVPSTISFSSHTITASANGQGVESQLITSPEDSPLQGAENYYITITSVSDGKNTYVVTNTKDVYYNESNRFVFQIVGNGSLSPTIYTVAGTYTISIAVASVNPATNRHLVEVVEWASDYDYASLLRSKTTFATGSYTQQIQKTIAKETSCTFSAIYTEVSYVTITSAPEASFNSGSRYVNFADNTFSVATASTNSAYVLNNWSSRAGSTVAENGKVTLAATPSETLTANYVLALPSVAVSNVSGNTKGEVSFTSIANEKLTISNKDNSISYTYTWFKKNGSTYTAVTNLVNSEHSNGTYAVKVKAAKTGYSAVESDFVDFTITFTKIGITLSANDDSKTYDNTDSAVSGYIITAAGGVDATYTVEQLLAENSKADKDRLFTVTLAKGGVAVREIKNVGTYTLAISLFKSENTDNANYAKYLYNDFSVSFTFTINPCPIAYVDYYNEETKFSKTFRQTDPSLTLNLNKNNETVVVTYTRNSGEDVGQYDLISASITNTNYTLVASDETKAASVSLPSGNKRFTINVIESLTISAKAMVSGSLVYNNTTPNISGVAYSDNAWKFTVSNGVQTVTITLSDLKEGETNTVPSDYISSALNELTFTFVESEVKGVGTYTFTTNWTSTNYPGGFIFEGTAPTISITAAKIAYETYYKTFSKEYGENDPALTNTLLLNNENVVVTFARVAGEKVDNYNLLSAASGNDNYLLEDGEGNYVANATLKANNSGFAITKRETLTLKFKLASTFVKTYDGIVPTISENATYENGKWTITVGGTKITLNSFAEQELNNRVASIDERTLSGVSFALNATADAGKYTITALLQTAEANATYTRVSLENGTNAVEITKFEKTLELSDLTIVDNSFSKTFRADEPTAIKATATLVGEETLTLTFTRDTANQDVGKYALTGVSITAGGNAGNYNLTLPTNQWFEIKADSTAKITATATNVELTYNNQVPTITKGEVGTLTVSNGNSATITISGFAEAVAGTAATLSDTQISEIWENATFAIASASKNVGEYTITATLVHNNYPAGMTLTGGKITINAKTITIPDSETPLFTKTYREADPELVMTFTSATNSGILGSDSVKVTFTRNKNGEATEAVGKYALTNPVSANSNYTVQMAVVDNELFEIKRLEGLFITAEISGTTNSITYSGAQNYTVASSCVEGTGWTLTVSGQGITNATFTLSNLQAYNSTDETTSAVSNISTALEGMTFGIDRAVKDVGNYTIVGKAGTSTTYAGITITNSLNVISVTAKSITVDATFSKNYGTASDGALDMDYSHSTVDDIVSDDTVNVVFERAEGEKVGDYNLSIVSWDNSNYNVTLGTNSKFTINKLSALELGFKVSGIFTKTYDAQTVSIGNEGQATWTGSKWTITVVNGTTSQTFDLIDFVEVGLENRTITPDERTLVGVTFSISGAPKNVGSYNITASLTGTNVTYTAVSGTVGENAIVINKLTKELVLSELTVVDNSFSKTFRAAEPTITAKANPTEHEELTLTFTRAAGQDVGEYDLTLTGGYSVDNYTLTIPANNKWFEIEAATSSKIKAEADVTAFSFTYDGTIPTVSAPTFNAENKTWSIVISNKTQTQTIVLSNFVESVTGAAVPSTEDFSKLLAGITFSFTDVAKDAKSYTLTATTNGTNNNYLQGFEFVGSAPVLTINKVEISLTKENTSFGKTYGTADDVAFPSGLVKTYPGQNGEVITVTFKRENGEDVGEYKLSIKSVSSENYNVVLPADNDWFEILVLDGLGITASVSGDAYSIAYGGIKNFVVEAEFVSNSWELVLKEGDTELKRWILSNFKEVKDNQSTTIEQLAEATLSGITFAIDKQVKDVGTYKIVSTGSNKNYPTGFTFTGNSNLIIVEAKELTLSNITKQFDQTTSFDSSAENNTLTINGLVEGESVVVKGQFENIGVGSNIALSGVEISGEYASNYVLADSTFAGAITKSAVNMTLAVNKTAYTYGELTNGLSEIVVSATINDVAVDEYLTTSASIEGATYSTGLFLKKGTYTLKISPSSEYYTVEEYTVKITVSALEISVYVDGEISKVYDGNDEVEQALSLETVLANDIVTVSGNYSNKQPGTDIPVAFTLAGADGDNYTLSNATATGNIERAIINVKYENNTISFVDGVLAAGATSTSVGFPFETPASEILESLTKPTKTGYEFTGWAYGDSREELTEENIVSAFEASLESKELTIYANWKINKYTITIVIDSEQGSYAASPVGEVQSENILTYNYFDTITITSVANAGYVALNDAQQITNIAENTTVSVNFRAAVITFNVSVDKTTIYPFDGIDISFGENWIVSGNGVSASQTIDYTKLADVLAKDFLPAISVKGYTLAGWTSGEHVVAANTTDTLKDVVLALNSSFTSDIELSFTTSFTANRHSISFDVDGGSETPSNIEAIYGQTIGSLPEVTKAGFDFGGWELDGVIYTDDTIFAFDNDITLKAIWSIGIYNLTVDVENATFNIKEQSTNLAVVPVEGVYKLDYTKVYVISVESAAGYKVTAVEETQAACEFDYSIEDGNAVATIKKLFKSGIVKITTEAVENTFTINIDHAQITVTVGGEKILDNVAPTIGADNKLQAITFEAKTAQEVVIEVVPEAGYDVVLKSLNGAEYSKADNVYTISGFTSDVSATFEGTAQQHTVTFNLGVGVTGVVEYQGAEKQTATTFVVTTGVAFSFALEFDFGYEYDHVETQPTMNVNDESTMIEITGFTEAFIVNIVTKKRMFTLTSNLFALDKDGSVKSTDGFSVNHPESGEYLSTVTFTATKDSAMQGYGFIGWFEGEFDVEDGKVEYDLNKLVSKDLEYNRVVDKDVTLTAIFQYSEFKITVSVSGSGSVKMGDEVVAGGAAESEFTTMLFYGTHVEFTAEADSGFEFEHWIVNDVIDEVTGETFADSVRSEMNITAVFKPKELTVKVDTVVSISGVRYSGEYIKDLSYGLIEWGTYENGVFTKNGSSEEGLPLEILTHSGLKTYVRVIAKPGYTAEKMLHKNANTPDDVVVNLIGEPVEVEGGNVASIFEIDKLNADKLNAENNKKYEFSAVFVANTSVITLVYKDADTRVDVGHIDIAVKPGVNAFGNSTSEVTVEAVTGITLDITASVRFGTSFELNEDNSVKIESNGLDISALNFEDPASQSTGFAERIKFKVSGFIGGKTEIVVFVKPTTYSVKLEVYDEENNVINSQTVENVKVGLPIDMTGITVPEREGYSFAGFYTYLSGAGKQYINADGEAVAIWTETGYSWNGSEYEKDSNYDPVQKEFKLYASFVINKTKLTINAVPEALKNMEPTVAARVVITTLNEANSWTSEDDIFMAEVLYSARVDIQAPVYEGYRFAYWEITRIDSNGNVTTEKVYTAVIEELTHENYPQMDVCANYDVLVSISGNEGGKVYFEYIDRLGSTQRAEDQAYVPVNTTITLKAEANDGYEFSVWYDANDDIISNDPTFIVVGNENPITPSSFKAEFKGKDVSLIIGNYDTSHGRIEDITINGVSKGNSSSIFDVNVGYVIEFTMYRDPNFEIVFEGAQVIVKGDKYVYTVAYDDINKETHSLTLTPTFVQLTCDVQIDIKLTGVDIKDSELPIIGTVRFFDKDGTWVQVTGGTITFNDNVGRELTLEVIPKLNYKIASIMHDGQDVTAQLVAGSLSLPIKMHPNDEALRGDINIITIEFQRDMWMNVVNDEYLISGEGTRSNPYLIDSAEDLAFVARMVNIWENGNYTNAHYKLTSNISLLGKYWAPIGTESNPFNGTFNFDVFTIDEISITFGYEGELDSTKVFGYLGPDANITEANQELMIVLIVVGSVVGLTIIGVVVFLILRRKRRKKLEELQNG